MTLLPSVTLARSNGPVPRRASCWLRCWAMALGLAGLSQAVGAQGPAPAGAAPLPTFNVEQLTRLVLDHNPQLRAARSGVDAAQAGITSASALPNPRIEWHQGQRQLSPTPQQALRGWGVALPLDNPWLRRARIDAAESVLGLSQQQLAGQRNDLVAQLRARVSEAVLHQLESESASEALALLEQVRERVRVRVESGEAARYEIIKADAEVIHARERQRTAQLQAEQALLEINRLAAGQLPARWKLQGSFHDGLDLPDLAQLQAQAEQLNPELAALRREHERALAQARAARASRWPGMELRYSDQREDQARIAQWGVAMQLPLLDQRRGPVAEADAEVERSLTRLQGRQQELRQQVLLSWRALDMARLRVEALSQGVLRDAEAALRVAQAAYRFGERGILDVLDAQRVLRGVRSDLLQARYQQQLARIALDQLSGQHVSDVQP